MTVATNTNTNTSANANFCRHLKQAALDIPSSLAVSVQKNHRGTLNYSEIDFATLDQKSDAIAFALNAYGIKRGMKAVLMVTPSLDFFALTFALFKAGIVPILVDPGMGTKNLKQCFIESAPDVFIGIPKAHIARKLFGWGKNSVKFLLTVSDSPLAAVLTGGSTLSKILTRYSSTEPYQMVWLEEKEMAAILFTSGSTGTPKGVVYSHKMFEAQISVLKNDYQIVSGERDLATFPLFSLFGPALGMASIVPDMDASKPIKANPEFIFAAIKKYQCTNLFANPALIEVLGQAAMKNGSSNVTSNASGHLPSKGQKLSSLKRVISAGAPATITSIERFCHMLNNGVEVLTSYGATESLPLTKIGSDTLLTTTEITDNGGGICVGTPVDGVDVAIIKITEDNISQWHDDLKLPTNSIGEIVVKGSMVSESYYQRDSATKHAKILDQTEKGVSCIRHRMGDLGYFDQQGQLWMCGRKAHRVETASEVFFSIPCERIFNRHPKVKRTALVSFEMSKEVNSTGQNEDHSEIQPLLCVELEKGVEKLSGASAQQLFEELKELGREHSQTRAIERFLIHPDFPVDIRHNAKIFREKLAVWAKKTYKH
ncbi:MAG: AMP-binding protein [Alteromonadaceae bacterium]|nr:AMP-binding protein [Alteromonadaceae bacterium]